MAKDYYDILGVKKDASPDDIKRSFRRLAHQHHPDKVGGDAERFKEINQAYQVLSDPAKREQYDRFGTAEPAGGMNWQDFQRARGFDFRTGSADGGGFGDIFSEIFGFGGRREETARGGDVEVELSLDFREAIFGANKVIELSGAHVCDRCHGRGAEPGSALVTCSTCRGRGVVESVQQTILGGIRAQSVCSSCGGSGQRPKTNCKRCHGSGAVRGKRQLRIDIPAGIDDGQSIRLRAQGEPGRPGSTTGDLYVRIRVRPDQMFRRDGDDILTRRTITISQAALGGQVKVETLDGPVDLEVPPGTQSGKLFRLRGKGVPHLKRQSRGDQIVEVIVKVPDKLTREQRRLLEKLAALDE